MKPVEFKIGDIRIGQGAPLFLIAGPCVIESLELCLGIADRLSSLASTTGVPVIFKASFDKANRSSASSFRGPGMEKGLEILSQVRKKTGLPILTDVHEPSQAAAVAAGADGLFLEVHPEPKKAMSDAACVMALDSVEKVVIRCKKIFDALRGA